MHSEYDWRDVPKEDGAIARGVAREKKVQDGISRPH